MNNWKVCFAHVRRGVLDEVNATEAKPSSPRVRAKKKPLADTKPATVKLPKRLIRDGQRHIKVKVLSELESITNALVEKAKGGGTAQLRLLWDLGKLHQDATSTAAKREPSLSDLLMREIKAKRALKK